MSLSPAQLEARKGKLTASAVGRLMHGTEETIIALWGDPTDET